ncbi:MAG: class I SAM-dependent methyltransferase [Filifactoraceae bacterium]
MEVSNILICGNFEDLYSLQGKTKFCILDTEEELAQKNAYFKNIKLYNSISKLPSNIKWAYIPQISLIAANNSLLRQELLAAGISIIDQMPLNANQIKDCLRIANDKKIYYIPEIPGTNDGFFEKCMNVICGEFNKNNILYFDGIFSDVLIYYVFKILKEGLQTNQKITITNEYSDSITTTLSGYILSIPFCIRIYSSNINKEYKFVEYNDELKIFTKNGCITMDFIYKKILYNSNMFEKSIKDSSFLNQTLENKHKLNIHTVIDSNMKVDLITYRSQIQEILNDFTFIQDINKVLSYNKNLRIGKYEAQNNMLKTLVFENRFNYKDLDTIDINKEISDIERKYSHIHDKHLSKYKEKLVAYILGEIFIFFRENGAFNERNVKYSEEYIINDCFEGKNSKIVKRWLKNLVLHGFIEYKEGDFYSIKSLQIDTTQYFCELRKLWDWKLGDPYSIEYIRENVKHLNELFYGNFNCNAILFPESDIKYATALYKDNIIYRFLNEIIGIQVSDYVDTYCSKIDDKITILEVGAGIGATTDNIIESLEKYNLLENVNYLYTDISNFFLSIGKEKYSSNSNISYLKLDVDNINELKAVEDANIIVAAGVLNNSKHLERVVKELLKKIKLNGMLLITEPMDEPIEMLVSQVFMMEEPDDIRKVKNSTFLGIDDWIELINRCGDFEVSIFPGENHSLNIFGQKLFVIRNKGW